MHDLWNDLVERMKSGEGELWAATDVERGQFGDMPLRPPFVLVFLEPGDPLSIGGPAGPTRFTATLFFGAAPERDGSEAVVRAYDMARAGADLLAPLGPDWPSGSPIQLDTVHPDFTATRLTALFIGE